ncbi:hypothetical protein EYF80_021941 [Liparis tanakae]|uniref:Uncharacterized protein n=1 Tax=Liparis tanakae TaxID=230148 RepID=A0A4Z2HPT3_9TELE|nr:hypothetical protein EYF80_021941 [Liparis tanakae]
MRLHTEATADRGVHMILVFTSILYMSEQTEWGPLEHQDGSKHGRQTHISRPSRPPRPSRPSRSTRKISACRGSSTSDQLFSNEILAHLAAHTGLERRGCLAYSHDERDGREGRGGD